MMPFLLCAVILLAGCAHTPFADLYRPGTGDVTLWGGEIVPIDPHWNHMGQQRVTVSGTVWNSNLSPTDEIRTLVFTRETTEGPAVLLLSQVIKTGQTEIFRFLGGNKTEIGGRSYRESVFGLTSDSIDPEYRRYFEIIRTAGLSPAPSYAVRVLDRLPVDTVLIRIMELTPGQAEPPLPAFGLLYPQERLDMLPRRLF